MDRHPLRYYVERENVKYNTMKTRLAVARRLGIVDGLHRVGNILMLSEVEWEAVKKCRTYTPRT